MRFNIEKRNKYLLFERFKDKMKPKKKGKNSFLFVEFHYRHYVIFYVLISNEKGAEEEID